MEAVYSKATVHALFQPVQRVYVMYGEEDLEKDEALDLLRKAVIEEGFADFDYEELEAERMPPDEILAAVGTAPLGSPYRLVVLNGAELYRKREKQGEADQLAAGMAQIGSQSCLALRVAAAEDEKSRGKTILTAKLDAAARAQGSLIQFKALTEQRLADWLYQSAKASGKRLHDEAADTLMRAGRGDRQVMLNELEKAICFVGDAPEITVESARAVCSFDPEDVMFRLVDAITQRDADRALRLLRELLRYDTKPQSVAGRLLALLARQYRLLWQAHELQRRRIDPTALKILPTEITSELPTEASIVSMSWKGRELFQMARSWDRTALRRAFNLLIECDLANKGTGEGSDNVIANVELLIFRLCREK